jgi:hypothetical protein
MGFTQIKCSIRKNVIFYTMADELSHSGTMENKSIASTNMALGKMTFSNGLFWPVRVGKSRHGHRDILPDRLQHCHAVYALHKRIG